LKDKRAKVDRSLRRLFNALLTNNVESRRAFRL